MKKNGQIYDIFRVLNEDKKLKIFYLLALMADALVFPLAQVFTSFSEKWLVNAVEFHDRLYIDGVKSLFSWSFHRFFLAVFYGFGSIALMVCLAAVILILSFFEIFCMSKVSVKIQKLSKEIQDGKAGGNNLYSAFLRCLKCIRMLSLHDIMYEKFSRINAEIAKLQTKRGSHIAGMNVVNDFFSAVNLLGVLFAGIILYFGGYVDLGSVMAFLVVQDGITYMFNNLKDFFASLQRYLINIKRVYEVIDYDFAPKDARHRQAAALSEIQCKSVCFKYDQESAYILEDVNLKMSGGDIVAVVGESGGGKSTLVKLIMGFYQPTKGNICYDTIKNTEITNDEICGLCAYVPQFPYLFYDTVAENIRGGTETASFSMVRNAADLAGATDFIMSKEHGFDAMVMERGTGYSGGQRQKIAIARAILSNKSVIVFDEATSALDLESEKMIYAYLQKEAQRGKIVILVSHRESVKAICNRVFRVENGKVNELGRPQSEKKPKS